MSQNEHIPLHRSNRVPSLAKQRRVLEAVCILGQVVNISELQKGITGHLAWLRKYFPPMGKVQPCTVWWHQSSHIRAIIVPWEKPCPRGQHVALPCVWQCCYIHNCCAAGNTAPTMVWLCNTDGDNTMVLVHAFTRIFSIVLGRAPTFRFPARASIATQWTKLSHGAPSVRRETSEI